jgi:Zn-dependent protease with chaperone function
VEVEGRYSDGKRAVSTLVRVRLDHDHLTLTHSDGAIVAIWPLVDVRLIDDLARHAPARLAPGPERDERLSVTSSDLVAELKRRNRKVYRDVYGKSREWKLVLWWGGGAIASLVALFTIILPLFAHQLARLVPESLERRMGAWMADLVIAQFGPKEKAKALCDAPQGVAALDRLAQRLAQAMPPRTELTVRVVNSKIVNALALPGGQVLFFRGLIDKAASPNAVAGVLAHEIAHVDLRHATEVTIQKTTTGVLVGMLMGDVVGFSVLGSLAQELIGSRYTREAETAADARAVAMMRAAGLATHPFAIFMEQMQSGEGGPLNMLAYLASHPPSPERAARIRAGGAEGAVALTQAEWTALKTICPTSAPD